MFRWIPYAFVRIVLFFCAGILWAIYDAYLLSNSLAWKLFAFSVALFFILTFFRSRFRVNPGIPGLAAIFLAGFLNVHLHTRSRSDDHLNNFNSSLEYYRAVVVSTPQEKNGFWKMEVSTHLGRTKGDWRQMDGATILYLHQDSLSRPINLGDELLVKGSPQPVAPPKNPGEFDYKQFLEFKNIYHQHFVTPNEVLVVGRGTPGVLRSLANDTRSKAVGILKKYISGEREQAMALALILGVKDDLDPEVRDAYAASGAMHVLAVSGLHVGIIYWLILILAKPFQKGPTSKWIIAIISLLILWSYALVTGLSPSVMRAVTMFSFFSLARVWNQRTNVYNVLAASAFCLLLYNPHFIVSVGFQLSYMAVIGIVTLQPRLYRLWEPDKLVWDHVWKICTVAIAAQLATFPLGIFYFNQFPNYFLLSNIVVIPGAFMVLVGGMLLLVVSFSSPMAGLVGEMLGWVIKGINAMIFGIERLPFSHVENIYIDSFQCILIIGIVAMGYLFFEYRSSFYLISTAAAIVALSFSMWIHYSSVVARPTLTIYNVPGHTAIDFAQHGKVQFIADRELMGDVSKADYFIRPNRCRQGVQKTLTSDSIHREFEGCTIFAWQNRTILRIHSPAFRIPSELKVDYVIVSNDAVQRLDSVVNHVETKEIILDSSNSFYRTKTIMAESENLSVPVFSVRHEGAFTIKI